MRKKQQNKCCAVEREASEKNRQRSQAAAAPPKREKSSARCEIHPRLRRWASIKAKYRREGERKCSQVIFYLSRYIM